MGFKDEDSDSAHRNGQQAAAVLRALGWWEPLGVPTGQGQRYRWNIGYAEQKPLTVEEQLEQANARAADKERELDAFKAAAASQLEAMAGELEALRAALAMRDAAEPQPLAQRPDADDARRPAAAAANVPAAMQAPPFGVLPHESMLEADDSQRVNASFTRTKSQVQILQRPQDSAADLQTSEAPRELNGAELEALERQAYEKAGGAKGKRGDWTMLASLHLQLAGELAPRGDRDAIGRSADAFARFVAPWWACLLGQGARDERFREAGYPPLQSWIDRHLGACEQALRRSLVKTAPATSPPPPAERPRRGCPGAGVCSGCVVCRSSTRAA